MSGDPQLIKYFAQCPELSFYSVAQLFKSVGFDVVLFVCVSCRRGENVTTNGNLR